VIVSARFVVSIVFCSCYLFIKTAFAADVSVNYGMPENLMEKVEISASKPGAFQGTYSSYSKAYQALTQRKYEDALQLFNTILAKNPRDVSALFGLAITQQRRSNPHAAIEIYGRLLTDTNLDARTRAYAQVNLAYLQPEKVGSVQLFNDARNAGVDAAFCDTVRGYYMLKQGKYAEAWQAYLNVYTNNDSNPVFQYNLAVAADTITFVPAMRGQYPATFKRFALDAVKYYQLLLSNPDRLDFFTKAQLAQLESRVKFLQQEVRALPPVISAAATP
jgi:tetratricopeptide (TPR) repeat protein